MQGLKKYIEHTRCSKRFLEQIAIIITVSRGSSSKYLRRSLQFTKDYTLTHHGWIFLKVLSEKERDKLYV